MSGWDVAGAAAVAGCVAAFVSGLSSNLSGIHETLKDIYAELKRRH